MKIAVTSKGSLLTSSVDERFGRAEYFLFVNPESLEYKVIENTASSQGAGISAAKTVLDEGAELLITGTCGPKAFRILKEANIDIAYNSGGRVIDAIQQYKNGMLSLVSEPDLSES